MASGRQPVEPQNFVLLDGLRGLGATLVLIGHILLVLGPIVVPGGAVIVDLFFLLSGFVIAFSYESRFATGMRASEFMLHRIVRLYPLYFLGIVLGYVLLQNMGDADTDAVEHFVTQMAQVLHGVAPNQLVSLDLSWGVTSGNGGAAYRRLQALPFVDYVDVDDYQVEPEVFPIDDVQLALLSELDKPAVIGEGAFELPGGDAAAFNARAERARTRLQRWRDWGLEGALLWAYQPGWSGESEEFDARPEDPLLQPGGVLANAPW